MQSTNHRVSGSNFFSFLTRLISAYVRFTHILVPYFDFPTTLRAASTDYLSWIFPWVFPELGQGLLYLPPQDANPGLGV